jgi:hypothetical protein
MSNVQRPTLNIQHPSGEVPLRGWRKVARFLRERVFFTATVNSAREMATLGESANAVTLPLDLPADGWFVIAPYGEHAAPDGSYVQIFGPEQAARVVETWNSLSGRAVRWVHNLKNGVSKFSLAAPVWEGHPDVDAERWPRKNLLAQLADVRVGAQGLEGRATFNAEGMAQRGRGPLKPSPYWMHEAPDASGRVFPELLLSVGLVPAPNIPGAPAWTRNAPDHDPNSMNQKDIALSLGLAADATWDQIKAALGTATANAAQLATATANAGTLQTTLNAAQQQLATITTERDTLLAEKLTLTGEKNTLTTANSSLTSANASLSGERDTLKTNVAALTTTNAALQEALLTVAEKTCHITAGEKDSWKEKLTANAAGAAKELAAKAPSLNTRSLPILNSPEALATANARQAAIGEAVKTEMATTKCDYDTAYNRVMAKPEFKPVVAAMQDPTRAS